MTCLEFILASLLIELTPGPNMGWLALLAARRGRAVGLAAVAGVSLGLAAAGAAAAFGLSLLVQNSPWLFQSLRWAGAAYMLYLARDAWRDSGGRPIDGTGEPVRTYFYQGLLSNILNPKAYLVYAAVLPQFLPDASGDWWPITLLTIIYVAVATLVHASIVLLAGSASALLGDANRRRQLARLSALLLVVMAFWFFWSTGKPA
jgi:threonine/homoserine/homoserine lactone efflux protein